VGGGCAGVEVGGVGPGDAVEVEGKAVRVEAGEPRPECDLKDYSRRRAAEWGEFYAGPEPEISEEDVAAYFARLQRRNRHLLHDFSKRVRLVADGRAW